MTHVHDPDPDSTLLDVARRVALDGRLIVVFADSGYRAVLMNWLVALTRLRIDGYLVIALDRALHADLEQRGIPVFLSEVTGDLGALWIRRIEIFAQLSTAGLRFVHSDADAVWLRDPRADHLDDPSADLVISQGTVWPPDCFGQFGFVLCCGLFALASSATTHSLLRELAGHVMLTGDDQVSLNRLVARRAPRWVSVPADAYHLEFEQARIRCSRVAIRGTTADGLRISVLPHHLFQRIPLAATEHPCVVHPLSPKEAGAKLQLFAQLGCLFLRPDWEQVAFDVTTLERLCA